MAPQPIVSRNSATAGEEKKPNPSTGPKTTEGKRPRPKMLASMGWPRMRFLSKVNLPMSGKASLTVCIAEWSPATLTEELLLGDMAKHQWLKDCAIRI